MLMLMLMLMCLCACVLAHVLMLLLVPVCSLMCLCLCIFAYVLVCALSCPPHPGLSRCPVPSTLIVPMVPGMAHTVKGLWVGLARRRTVCLSVLSMCFCLCCAPHVLDHARMPLV